MNRIDLTNLGGFPLEQDTLKFMQDGYGDLFEAVARLCGDKTILTGVVVTGSNVSDGWISYNGELLKFVGGSLGAGVIIVETIGNALFEDGGTKGVYKTRTATIGSPQVFAFSDLVRIDTMASQFSILAALNALPRIRYKGTINLGNLPAVDGSFTVTIPDQGANDYYALVQLVVNDTNHALSNDVSWVVYDKQNTSFKISTREYEQVAQNLRAEFIIVK